MSNEHLRAWQICHAGCECPDCETIRHAAVGLAREIVRRASAEAGKALDFADRCIDGLLAQPESVRLLFDDPAGFLVWVDFYIVTELQREVTQ